MTATVTSITQLGEFCEMTYGVPRMQVRILVSTYLPTRYMPLWLMVDAERCRFLEDLEYAVMKLEYSMIIDTFFFRKERAHLANKYINVLMTSREKPQLFANRYWEWPGPIITARSRYPILAAECLRLKLEYDPAKQPGELARDELFKLVKNALAEARVDRGGIVPAGLGETFSRRALLLPKIDRHLTSLTALMRNFGFVVSNHAAIAGRPLPNEEDLTVQRYMLRSAVPIWAEKIIQVLLNRGKYSATWQEIIRDTRQAYEWQWHYGGRNVARPPLVGQRIIHDFWIAGLIEKNKHSHYYLKPQYADDLQHILEARA